MNASNHSSMTFDITELANKWVYSGVNNGLALKYSNKRDSNDDDHNSSVIVLSRENTNGIGAYITIEYVILKDGVYSFKNVGNDEFHMDIQQNRTSPGYHVQQYNFTTAPESDFSRSGLYKISRDPETGMFIIRLMLNNKLSFGISGSEVLTKQISMDDTLVSATDMFTLEFAGDGYRIKPYNSNLVVSRVPGCEASGGAASFLTALSEKAAGNNGLWIPTKYTGTDQFGLTKSVSGDFIAGEQVTVTAVSWSTVPGVNRQNIYVHSNYTNVATSTMNTSTAKMTMDIHDEGAIRVIYDICYDGSSVPGGSFQDIWNSELPFDEGTYFFENVEEEQYMSLDDDISDKSTFGIHLELESFKGEEYQKWDVIHSMDGYYRIQNSYSGYVVTVQSAYVNAGDYALIQHTYDKSDIQLWKFEETTDDRWVIRPKSGKDHDTDWCMAAGAAELDGINVEQREYLDNNSYKDEWKFTKIQYNSNVFNYYDMGYPVRYGESSSIASSKIDSYVDMVAKQYMRLFGLELTPSNATYYQSPIDICKGSVNSNNIDATCSHTGVIHSERNNVISDFNTYHIGDSTTTYVLWSGHKIISTATNGELNYNRSCSSGTGIFMIEISTSNRERDSQGVLMHELNHQYGAKDHYHELADKYDSGSCKFKEICSSCGDNPRPKSCIMFNSRIDISNDDVICSGCQNDILTHLKDHHSN